jgi:hypothetical protein
MKLTYAVAAVSLLAAMVGAIAQTTSCRVSLSQFGYLQSGMTYDKIVQILGCDGSEMSRSEMAGYTTVMYMWSGQGMLGANMNIMLQNNRMVRKSQFGLAN